MSKEKPNSIPTSLEAQIRTRARNLPIHKCYVNHNWQEVQRVTILITRKHTNGNITFGYYLVDLKLRGVKDCICKFNESPLKTDEHIKRRPEMYEECDYSLVHNIIHAGLEFAADYGFEPHKDFKTAQYVLEEDTDDIPLMEIPLGDNGVPVLELHPEESGLRELAILKKTAGDNFHIVYLDEKGNPKRPERSYIEIVDDVLKIGIEAYLDKCRDTLSSMECQVINDLLYIVKVFTEEEQTWIDEEFDRVIKDPRLFIKEIELEDGFEEELALSIRYFEEGKTDKAYAETRKVIDRHPENPMLWNTLLYNVSIGSEEVDQEAVQEAYSRFPEHPVIKAWYAEWLAQEDREDEIFTLFNHLPALDALTTENIRIDPSAVPSFCFAYAMAWLSKKDILRAEPYYQIIVRLELDYRLGDYIQFIMTEMKKEKIKEMADAGMFSDDEEPEDELKMTT